MIDRRWKAAVELLGLVAIVSSLIFVGMEIQQERDLARSDIAAQTFQNNSTFQLMLSNPDFARTYAKVLENPNDLTIEEKLQIDSYLRAFTTMIRRECYLTERDVFAECRGIVQGMGPDVFGSRYAQAWWQVHKPPAGPYFPEWVDSLIRSFDPDSKLHKMKTISVDH